MKALTSTTSATLTLREQNQVVDRLRRQQTAPTGGAISSNSYFDSVDSIPNALVDHQPLLVRHHQLPATASRAMRARPTSFGQRSGSSTGNSPAVMPLHHHHQQQYHRETSPPAVPFFEPPATAPASPSQQQQQQQQHFHNTNSSGIFASGGGASATAAANNPHRIRNRDLVSTAALKRGDPLMSMYVALPASNHESLVKLFMDADVPEEAERLQRIVVPGELFAAAEARADGAEARFMDAFTDYQRAEHEVHSLRQAVTELKLELSRANADVHRYASENSRLVEAERTHQAKMQAVQQQLELTRVQKAETEKQLHTAEAYVAELQQKNAVTMARTARLHADLEISMRHGAPSSAFLISTRGIQHPTSNNNININNNSAPNSTNDNNNLLLSSSELLASIDLISVPAALQPAALATEDSNLVPPPAQTTRTAAETSSLGSQTVAQIPPPAPRAAAMSSSSSPQQHGRGVAAAAARGGVTSGAAGDSVEARLARSSRELAKLRLKLFVREVTASRQIAAIKTLAAESQAELASYKRRFVRQTNNLQGSFAASNLAATDLNISATTVFSADASIRRAAAARATVTDPSASVSTKEHDHHEFSPSQLSPKEQLEREEILDQLPAPPTGFFANSNRLAAVQAAAGATTCCTSQRCRTLKHALRDRLALLEQAVMGRFDVDANKRRGSTNVKASSSLASNMALTKTLSYSPSSRTASPDNNSLSINSSASGVMGDSSTVKFDQPAAAPTASATTTSVAPVAADASDDGVDIEILKNTSNTRSLLGQLLTHVEECTRYVLSLGAETMPEAHHQGRTLHSNRMLFAASTALVDGAASFLASAETAVSALSALEALLFSSRSLPEARIKWAAARSKAQYIESLGVHVDTGAVAMRDSIVELRCFQRRGTSSGGVLGGKRTSFLGRRRRRNTSSGSTTPSKQGRGYEHDEEEEEDEEEDRDNFTETQSNAAESIAEDEAALDFRTYKLAHNIFNVIREFEFEISRQKANGVPVRSEFRRVLGNASALFDGNATTSNDMTTLDALRRAAAHLYQNTPEGIYRLMHDSAAKLRLVVPVLLNTMRLYKGWDNVLIDSKDQDKSLQVIPHFMKNSQFFNPEEDDASSGDPSSGGDHYRHHQLGDEKKEVVGLVRTKLMKKEQEQYEAKIKAGDEYRSVLLSKAHPRWRMLLGRLMTFSRKQLGLNRAAVSSSTWRADKVKQREAEKERERREALVERHAQRTGGGLTGSSSVRGPGIGGGRTTYVPPTGAGRGNVFERLHKGESPRRARTTIPDVVDRLYPRAKFMRTRSSPSGGAEDDNGSSRSSPHGGPDRSAGTPQRGRDRMLNANKGPQAALQRWLARRRHIISSYHQYGAGPGSASAVSGGVFLDEISSAGLQQQPHEEEGRPLVRRLTGTTSTAGAGAGGASPTFAVTSLQASPSSLDDQQRGFALPKNMDADTRALLDNKHVIAQLSSILRGQLKNEQDRTDRLRAEVLALRRQLETGQSSAQREESAVQRLKQMLNDEQESGTQMRRELQQAKEDMSHLRYELEKSRKQLLLFRGNGGSSSSSVALRSASFIHPGGGGTAGAARASASFSLAAEKDKDGASATGSGTTTPPSSAAVGATAIASCSAQRVDNIPYVNVAADDERDAVNGGDPPAAATGVRRMGSSVSFSSSPAGSPTSADAQFPRRQSTFSSQLRHAMSGASLGARNAVDPPATAPMSHQRNPFNDTLPGAATSITSAAAAATVAVKATANAQQQQQQPSPPTPSSSTQPLASTARNVSTSAAMFGATAQAPAGLGIGGVRVGQQQHQLLLQQQHQQRMVPTLPSQPVPALTGRSQGGGVAMLTRNSAGGDNNTAASFLTGRRTGPTRRWG